MAHWRWWFCPQCRLGVIRSLGVAELFHDTVVEDDIRWVCRVAAGPLVHWVDEGQDPEAACLHSPPVPDIGGGELPNVPAAQIVWLYQQAETRRRDTGEPETDDPAADYV